MVKLLPYDLEVTDSSNEISLLQSNIRMRIMNPSLGPCIDGSFSLHAPGCPLIKLVYGKLFVVIM